LREAARIKREQPPAEREEIERLHRLHDLPLEPAIRAINAGWPAPNVVAEAIIVSVIERGLDALKEAKNIDRVARLDEVGRRELDRRIRKLKQQNRIGVGLPAPDPSAQRFAAVMENDPEFQRIWRSAVDRFHGRASHGKPPMPRRRPQEGTSENERPHAASADR
jgi:hypothetical protein